MLGPPLRGGHGGGIAAPSPGSSELALLPMLRALQGGPGGGPVGPQEGKKGYYKTMISVKNLLEIPY